MADMAGKEAIDWTIIVRSRHSVPKQLWTNTAKIEETLRLRSIIASQSHPTTFVPTNSFVILLF